MPAVAAVRRRHDLRTALAPDVEHAVDRGRRQVRAVGEHDDGGLDVVAEGSQAAPERRSAAALPLGAANDPCGRLDIVRAEHDDHVFGRARAHSFENRLEQSALLDVSEAPRRSGREHDRSRQPDLSSILSIVTFSVGVPDGSDGLPSFPIFSTVSMPSVTSPRTA